MKGLELARLYWEAHADALFEGLPDAVRASAAAGLAGAGSECLGFDDDLSADHDFGPGFCVWLPADAFAAWGPELARRYDGLPKEFLGFRRRPTELAGQRVGVFETGAFLRSLTGLDRAPVGTKEWLALPERLLACVTSGEIFCDPIGDLTRVRAVYRGFYPEAVVRQKVAANCASMAQSGQYNLGRCLSRQDPVAAGAARTEFVMSLMAVLHLLSRVYMPFYKWAFRSLVERTAAPSDLAALVRRVAAAPVGDVSADDVEAACSVVRGALTELGWIGTSSDFLLDAATELWRSADDAYLRSCPLGAGAYW